MYSGGLAELNRTGQVPDAARDKSASAACISISLLDSPPKVGRTLSFRAKTMSAPTTAEVKAYLATHDIKDKLEAALTKAIYSRAADPVAAIAAALIAAPPALPPSSMSSCTAPPPLVSSPQVLARTAPAVST